MWNKGIPTEPGYYWWWFEENVPLLDVEMGSMCVGFAQRKPGRGMVYSFASPGRRNYFEVGEETATIRVLLKKLWYQRLDVPGCPAREQLKMENDPGYYDD